MSWKCKQCGKCCESITKILPEFALDNGVCCHLNTETRECRIYSARPLLCRVDEYYDRHYKYFMDKERYYAHQKIMCKLTREK